MVCEKFNDVKIAGLISGGSSDGLKMAIDIYGGAVKTICGSFLKGFSAEDVEETVSDTFTELWKSIGKYDSKKSELKYFVYGIARNCAKNKLKSLKKKIGTQSIYEEEVVSDEETDSAAINRINAQILTDMIRRLKPPADKIFEYKYIDNFKNAEIADKLKISVKKVENALFRGKTVLKRQFEKRGIL